MRKIVKKNRITNKHSSVTNSLVTVKEQACKTFSSNHTITKAGMTKAHLVHRSEMISLAVGDYIV